MDYLAQEELEIEFNSRFDYIHEAYAGTELDPIMEGRSDYLMQCDEEGIEPLSFDKWKASLKRAQCLKVPSWTDDVDFPF